MRITVLNQFYVPDLAPTAHLSASLAEHLAAAGHTVTVLTSTGGYVTASRDARSVADDNPRVRRVWTPRLGKANHFFRLIDYASFYFSAVVRMLLLPRQDVIVSLTTPPLIGLTAVAHKWLKRRTKLVLWNMDCYPDAMERTGMTKQGGFTSRVLESLVRVQFRNLDHLVTLDTAMSDLLLGRYHRRKRELPTTVIPNWEELSLFPADTPEAPGLPAGDQPGERPLTVLYLGNMGYGHQFDTALAAAERLEGQPIQFLFVGGGRRWDEIAAEVASRGLGNLELRGYIPKEETPALMASVDCALITLRDWAKGVMSPSKMHSNLGMSLPVAYVGPEGSNIDDAIAAYGCGVSLRHGDTEGLVAYFRRLLAEPAFRQQQRAAARNAFVSRYCSEKTLAQFDEVIGAVTEDQQPPANSQ